MENCILKSPTLTQAMRLQVGDLQKLFVEHTVSDSIVLQFVVNLEDYHHNSFYGCSLPAEHCPIERG